MAGKPMASTAQEALIAELLGDVGKLHDMIKVLPDALKESLAPTIGELTQASKEARASLDQVAETQKAALQVFVAQEKAALRDAIKAALREEAGETLAGPARELETSARLHREAAGGESRQQRSWIGVALVLSLTLGALGFYGSYWLYSQERDEQAAFGRAVMMVWDKLDAAAKSRIQAARRQP